MVDEYFYNADGEMMFVQQEGQLRLWTEFGIIDIGPGEIAVIPRGVKIRVELPAGPARGYLCENYGGAFTLPERGPIGACVKPRLHIWSHRLPPFVNVADDENQIV